MAKKYKCPYCELRLIRKDLIKHIDKKHPELIPQGFSSARLVYNQVNKVDCGKCRVCGKPTGWNEKSGRYDVLCGNPKCKEHMREEYKKNMLRVRGTYNILNDPEQQKKMLANRSISGSYKFSDGGVLTYTGSYEKKCLEFMDVVMQIPSKDILSPGPTIEYEYNGSKHFYITDFYYIPYNLIIEVKDGGDNLNNKDSSSMRASREKTIEKERIITDRGEYNYIRLTNNDFSQLLDVFMTIKEKLLEGDVSKTYKINESVIFENTYSKLNVKTPERLLAWMKSNIKYSHDSNWKLKTFDEVVETKCGDCHDQSLFEYTVFKDLNIKCGRLFMIEYIGDEIHDAGATHTICYFVSNNKYYWFENAWESKRGINGPYLNLDELKKDIYMNWDFSGKYDKLYICNLSGVKPGMGLEEYVTTTLDTFTPKKYFSKNSMNESVILENAHSKYDIENQVKRIAEKVKKDKKDPTGNQNCMLCTWCMEAWFRGYNILPRPVYSPTDIIFTSNYEPHDIVKNNCKVIHFRNKNELKNICLSSGNNSRYYIHINWIGSSGGHEFILINIDDIIYIIDAQQGLFENIDSNTKVSNYFNNINYDNSYIIRMDDKQFNHKLIKYNDNKYIKDFTKNDMKYIDESTGYNHYSKDVHTIIDNLSGKEYQYINGGEWVDSNHIIYRKVEYLNNKPIGFIDVYSLPKFDKNIGLVVLAVAKEARGKGIGSELVREAIFNHKENKDINKLRWLADSNNIASINMAKSLGFKLNNDGQDKKEFIYDLRGDKNIHDNDLIKKEYTDIEGELSINESSESVFIYKGHCPDDKEYTMESIIFNSKDTYYNKDKFDSGEINLCFITGFSGSGKSTMANEMEKNGIEKYELDDIVFQFNFSDENLKEYGGMISSFFNGPGKKYRTIKGIDDLKTDKEADDYQVNICIDFIDYAKKYAASHKDKKFIVEGVEIFGAYIDKIESLKDYAIYIKGTSLFNSYIRSAKRDSQDAETDFGKFKSFMKMIASSSRFKQYLISNTRLNKIKKQINEYVTESEDKSELTKGFKSKTSNVQYKTLSIDKPEIYDYLKDHFSKNNPMWEGVKDSKTYMDCFINGNNSRHIKRVGEIFINKVNDEVIGFEVVEKPNNYLAIEIPDKKYRGYGFGSLLLEDAIKKHGCKKLYVAADNKIAIKMYTNRGFEKTGEFYDGEYWRMELNKSSMKESCRINTYNTGFVHFYIKLFANYMQDKYKSNVNTVNIKFIHSKVSFEKIKEKIRFSNYSNDFLVRSLDTIYVIDENLYDDWYGNYNNFLRYHIAQVILSMYSYPRNERLINAICTYESGTLEEFEKAQSKEIIDAKNYRDYLNSKGINMVIHSLSNGAPILEAYRNI